MKKVLYSAFIVMLLICCDTNHTSEYNRISRYDIAGYETFIEKYPTSIHVSNARERIEVAKERQRQEEERARQEEQQRQLEYAYGENSLANGSQPYALSGMVEIAIMMTTPHIRRLE